MYSKDWTIFLDRDGVINKKIENDYVKDYNEFVFIQNSLKGIAILSNLFSKIIIVTNQRGVGKGLFTENDLILIHEKMMQEIRNNFGNISGLYYCTDISDKSKSRKPNIGMALNAKNDFPNIDFSKSVVIGDSESDMIFGCNLGMQCLYINNDDIVDKSKIYKKKFNSLYDSALYLKKNYLFNNTK